MFSLIPSDANDPKGLMRRKEPNKQTLTTAQKDIFIAPLRKSGAILDLGCPSFRPSFRHSDRHNLVSAQYLENTLIVLNFCICIDMD